MKKSPRIPVRLGEVIHYCPGLILAKLVDEHEIRLEDSQELIHACVRLADGSDFVTILDGGVSIDISNEAMNYTAKYPDKNWLAFAIIVRTLSERIFANYYIRFTKQVRPTKVFSDPKEAVKWLSKYVPIRVKVEYEV